MMMMNLLDFLYWARWENKHLYLCCKTIFRIKATEFVQSWNTHNHKQKSEPITDLERYSYTCTTSWESKLKNANIDIYSFIHSACAFLPALLRPWRVGSRLTARSTLRGVKQRYTATTTACHIGYLSEKYTSWCWPPSLKLHRCNLHRVPDWNAPGNIRLLHEIYFACTVGDQINSFGWHRNLWISIMRWVWGCLPEPARFIKNTGPDKTTPTKSHDLIQVHRTFTRNILGN